ncbi:MAG: DUF4376 domain-containing protein [Phenylobacterium sp.]|uniref:DUF4376 domain-containing protein n=1 Tax=Phenylobacterium sp. TaxID=1871053 RepID=UPI00391D8282
MKRRALLTPTGPVEISGAFVANEIQHPPSVLATWTDEQLAEIGVVEIHEPFEVPYGSRQVGSHLALVADVVTEVLELEPIPLAELKAAKVEDIRAKRWAVETAGIVRNGVRIATDEKGQGKITGAVLLFDKQPGRPALNWESAPGVFVELDLATATYLGVEVGNHVQACFDRSMALCAAVAAAADAQALSSIDIEEGWPATAAE